MKLLFVLDEHDHQVWLKEVEHISFQNRPKISQTIQGFTSDEKKQKTKYFEKLKQMYYEHELMDIKDLVEEILRKYYWSLKPNRSKFNRKKVKIEMKMCLDKIEKDGKLRYIY